MRCIEFKQKNYIYNKYTYFDYIMALKIISKSISENRKRLDATVRVIPFWSNDYEISLRILARQSIDEDQERELLEEVVENKKKWKEGKKSRYLYLKGIPGTAFILNEQTIEE